ncbi:TATA box-binding protein-associated factor RNA polymerase I subunit D [Platysternon megacephalum]|uniref:TATA box-binding protein-associated factor RNA polymerase I subunit D n=1 Tax=Platysternon megacephalum TaxID=55544 RepID=A0A4D9ED98_9SAUR|nr:TATA box-binding protein-associated factor RNA polymerase I subunit D [Platysternon megacephalum]
MKGLLVLGLVALAAASELTLQERVVDLVLETFHNRKIVQWVYKKQAVEEVTERVYPAGPYVRLRVRLQQTQCPKQPGSGQDCALKRRGVSERGAGRLRPLSVCAAGSLLRRVISPPSTGERGCGDALPTPGNEAGGGSPLLCPTGPREECGACERQGGAECVRSSEGSSRTLRRGGWRRLPPGQGAGLRALLCQGLPGGQVTVWLWLCWGQRLPRPTGWAGDTYWGGPAPTGIGAKGGGGVHRPAGARGTCPRVSEGHRRHWGHVQQGELAGELLHVLGSPRALPPGL